MAELNLPNIREGGNIRFRIGLEDGGVAVDWSGLEDIRVFLYADAQKQVSGEMCEVAVDEEDNTVLKCKYSGDDVQYRGINSVLVRAKYLGEIKVYDKPAINIVARTSDATGVVEIDDPVVPVQISVEDVSTSLLNNAIDAAINAAAEAEKAAHLVPLQVLEDCVEATGKALEAASKAPYIDETTGNWFVWDAEAGEYVDSGKTARGATGNGIDSWSVVESSEDAGNNVVTVTFTDGTSESFNVKNGHTGNGIASIVQTVESPDDAGTNVITITMTNGTVVTFNVKNGSKGTPGVAQAAYKSVSSLPTASAQTMDKIYLTPSGTSGVYNMSYTDYDGSAYSWVDLGTTAIQLADYATKAEVTELDLSVNGGTKDTPISTAQDVTNIRINAGNGNMTNSAATDYSTCSFPVEYGKTYKLTIPKLTSAYTAAYTFNNAPLVANGATSVLPDPIVKGLLENYETQITSDDPSHTYLDVCYETAYGKPTLTTTTHSEGLVDKVESLDDRVASLEESVGDLSGDVETLSGDVETLSENVETIEDNVADLDSVVNGGTEITTIQPSNTRASIRIAKPAGTITTSAATNYSICTFPVELGKQYKLTIPLLTSAYAYAFGYISNDNIQAGDAPILPESPVSGPLNNYQTELTPMQTTGDQIFLIVTYETSGGVPTLTTETTTGGLVGDVADLKESVDALQNGGKITIKKVSNTEIDLYIPNKENTAYLIHPIIRNGYTLDLSADGGSSEMVCGDLYDPGDIVDAEHNAIVQGNLNFIYMVDSDASGSGYENEGSYHVGSGGGHGLEVMDYALFFADGKQFSISEMTEDIVCLEFRLVQKSKCYAVDNTHNTRNSHNYPKLVNGEPIVTAEHYLDAVYKPGNIIKWRNQLNIKRDHIVFKQLHAGMLRPYSTHLSKMVVSDNKMSRCEWGMIEGVWTVTYIPESNSLLPNTIKADEVFVSGDSTISVYQRMFQDNGARYEKSRMMFAEYSSTNSLKSYFMPAVVSRGSGSPETFNSGDILSVTNVREIKV